MINGENVFRKLIPGVNPKTSEFTAMYNTGLVVCRQERFFKAEEKKFYKRTRLLGALKLRSQSYDRELQRQRCEFLQRHG
jgi:hypothetical protein